MATAKKVGLITVLVILIIGASVMAFLYFGSYSSGSRSGIVTKISKKGYIFKTYEGELSTTDVNIFPFSVDGNRKDVVEALERASNTGERVTLHYEQKFVKFAWRGDTEYFIVKVDKALPIKSPKRLEEE